MRLVLPSRRRELTAALVVIALGLLACLLASGQDADAKQPASTAVVPNGTYGVLNASRHEYVVFTVRNRRVHNLRFAAQIACQASDAPSSEQRLFSGAGAPEGRLIPANGKLRMQWQERAEGRLGQVSAELHFGVRDFADFSIIVPEEPGPPAELEETKEMCDGGAVLRFRRGFEVPPMP